MPFIGSERIIGKLSSPVLAQIAKSQNFPIEVTGDKAIGEYLIAHVERISLKQLSISLSKSELEMLCAPLSIEYGKYNNPNSKTVLQKRFYEYLLEHYTTYCETISTDVLNMFLGKFDISPDLVNRRNLIAKLDTCLEQTGWEIVLSHLNIPVLKAIMDDMELDYSGTSSQRNLIQAILKGRSIKSSTTSPSRLRKSPVRVSRTKRPIKFGISYEDIDAHYTVAELVDWCRDNDVEGYSKPKKRQVIHVILEHLSAQKENSKPKKTDHTNRTSNKNTSPKSDKTTEKPDKNETTEEDTEMMEVTETPSTTTHKEQPSELMDLQYACTQEA